MLDIFAGEHRGEFLALLDLAGAELGGGGEAGHVGGGGSGGAGADIMRARKADQAISAMNRNSAWTGDRQADPAEVAAHHARTNHGRE